MSFHTISHGIQKWYGTYRILSYLLLVEALEMLLFGFALLLTLEALLPGLISFRLNLAKPFIAIILLLALTSFLGSRLGISFPMEPKKRGLQSWFGITWLAFLLTFSAIRFPSWIVPIIITSFFALSYLCWKIILRRSAA